MTPHTPPLPHPSTTNPHAPPAVAPLPPSPATNGHAHAPLPPPVAPVAAATPAHGDHPEDEIPSDLHRPHLLVVMAVGLLFLAMLAGLFYVGWKPYVAERTLAQADAHEEQSLIPIVTVSTPQVNAATHELILPCDVRPNQETLIYPRATGYLKKLYVDIQDHVTAGQLLAEIEAPEIDAELAQSRAAVLQSQANVVKAQADLDLAQRTLDRYQDVTGAGVTQQEKDEKRTARDQAKAALEQTKANVVAADANVQRLVVTQGFQKITAPFDGIITARNYDVGALLSASNNSTLAPFRLTQATTLRVFVNVPQIEASDVKNGQEATLTFRNFPGKTFSGSVARIAGAIDPNTRTMPYELHFPNPNNELFAGMYGEVRLMVARGTPAIIVPTSALVFNAGGTQVATVRDGKVHFQKVTVGRDMGTELEITEGVTPADHIVVNPGERLVEGIAVMSSELKKPTMASEGKSPPPSAGADGASEGEKTAGVPPVEGPPVRADAR